MSTNPNWVEAPLEIHGWTADEGEFIKKEIGRRQEGDEVVTVLKVTDRKGKLLRLEEVRHPKKFNPQEYSPC